MKICLRDCGATNAYEKRRCKEGPSAWVRELQDDASKKRDPEGGDGYCV